MLPKDDWQSSVASHGMSSRWDRDSDTQDINDSSCKSSERSLPDCTPPPNSTSIDAGPWQGPKIAQMKCNLPYGDNSDCPRDLLQLPAEPAQPGYWFLKLLQAETEQLEDWCCQMDKEAEENNLSEEVSGKVLSVVGNAQLLMSQKFQQFRGLCEQNLNPDANPCPTAQDLAGFWDLLQLSIEDIRMKFDELHHLKANSWQRKVSSVQEEGHAYGQVCRHKQTLTNTLHHVPLVFCRDFPATFPPFSAPGTTAAPNVVTAHS
uniref:DLG associated protein 4 n=1 Tax=Macaca nemestrina TaxID=9545 RepID=A0A2K6DRH6_MACNE